MKLIWEDILETKDTYTLRIPLRTMQHKEGESIRLEIKNAEIQTIIKDYYEELFAKKK